jgi:hypothetical protein
MPFLSKDYKRQMYFGVISKSYTIISGIYIYYMSCAV